MEWKAARESEMKRNLSGACQSLFVFKWSARKAYVNNTKKTSSAYKNFMQIKLKLIKYMYN